MKGMRQKIQYSLALELVVQGETPVSSPQGAEPLVAKLAQLRRFDPPFRDFRGASH